MVEKIGYPEICVNRTLLREYYQGVSAQLNHQATSSIHHKQCLFGVSFPIPFSFLFSLSWYGNNRPRQVTFSTLPILCVSIDDHRWESESSPEWSAIFFSCQTKSSNHVPRAFPLEKSLREKSWERGWKSRLSETLLWRIHREETPRSGGGGIQGIC